MGRTRGIAAAALCSAAAVTLMAVASGCALTSSENPITAQEWTKVASGHISGQRPVRLNLGLHHLGVAVRVAWVLSGPSNPPATLSLRVVSASDGAQWGSAMTPQNRVAGRRNDYALYAAGFNPGEFRVSLTQTFPRGHGPGFNVAYTIFTTMVRNP